VEAEGNVFGHSGGMFGKQDEVGIRDTKGRIVDGLVVEAYGSEQTIAVPADRRGLGNLAHRTGENCWNAGHRVISLTSELAERPCG
jgi:hypothetical protein